MLILSICMGLPQWLSGKESACNAGDPGSIPGLGRSPGEGNGYPLTPVFLPGQSHGPRSLVGYGPCGCKESDTTEVTENALTYIYQYGGNTVYGVLLPTSFQLRI